MKKEKYDELKAKFLKAYANVPPPLRNEIVALVGKETFSWSVAKEEIIRDTENSEKILGILEDIGVI